VGEAGVKNELRIDDGVADVTQGIGSSLHLLAVVVNGEVTLSHQVEFVTQEDGARGFVRLEARDRCPQLTDV
jgi:hypothetical protein